MRILLVEREAAVRRLLARYLEDRGCEVVAAEDTAAALTALDGRDFDAVLTAVGSTADAAGLWHAMTEQPVPLARRFVFMSASEPPADFLRMSGACFLAKPFRLAELWQAVSAAAGRQE
jgi:CheY-like chemotaxis protein